MVCPRCHREFDPGHRFCPYDGEKLSEGRRVDLFQSKPTQARGMILGGRYEVHGFIGKGAMARVYLAEDLETKRAVAVKVLNRVSSRAEKARDRFLREAKATALIGHPNIVSVLDVGLRRDGSPYIVMAVLHGASLGDFLRREGSAAPDIALPILVQTASALAAAHDARIVHRDVKPDNVFLVGEVGDPYAVKILDFGLAKLEAESGLTSIGMAVGTIEYMAPEQVVSDEPDGRSDVYGLGVVMYRMFTGRLPFSAEDEATLLAMQLLAEPPRPSEVRPGLDPGIEAVILRALRKRPDLRYPSMRAFLEDLERLCEARPGPLEAQARAPERPDVYEPGSQFSQNAADFFRRRLESRGSGPVGP